MVFLYLILYKKEDNIKNSPELINNPQGKSKEFIEQQNLYPSIKKNSEVSIKKERYEPTKICGPSLDYRPSPDKASTYNRQNLDSSINKSLETRIKKELYKSTGIYDSSPDMVSAAYNGFTSNHEYLKLLLSTRSSYHKIIYKLLSALVVIFLGIGLIVLFVILLLKYLF